MSAPTPISAIVHSSTLVTAGIFVIHKIVSYLELFYLCEFICFFRILTFLLGGVLANLELDFKKIIAFSTISQIRMLIFFCSLNLISLCLTHIIFHAFFKTLLFCCSGIFFMIYFRAQNFKLIKRINLNNFVGIIFFFRIFRIRGLFFSSSFFSKDLILEFFCSFINIYYFFFFLLGRLFTLFYCVKLIGSCFSWNSLRFLISIKYFNFYFWFIFIFFVLYRGQLFKYLVFFENFPIIRYLDLIIILFIFFVPFIFNFYSIDSISFFFSLEIFFIKIFSYSYFSNFFKYHYLKSVSFNDLLFFKEEYFNFLNYKTLNISGIFSISIYFLVFIFFINSYSYSL